MTDKTEEKQDEPKITYSMKESIVMNLSTGAEFIFPIKLSHEKILEELRVIYNTISKQQQEAIAIQNEEKIKLVEVKHEEGRLKTPAKKTAKVLRKDMAMKPEKVSKKK